MLDIIAKVYAILAVHEYAEPLYGVSIGPTLAVWFTRIFALLAIPIYLIIGAYTKTRAFSRRKKWLIIVIFFIIYFLAVEIVSRIIENAGGF